MIAKVDKSQIECRILNRVAEQWDVIEKFEKKIDPYIGIASQAYGFQVTKSHPTERGTGKHPVRDVACDRLRFLRGIDHRDNADAEKRHQQRCEQASLE